MSETPEKKKLTVEDLVEEQRKTREALEKIGKQLAWESLGNKKTSYSRFFVFGFGVLVLIGSFVATDSASAVRYFGGFDDRDAIGAAANRLQSIQDIFPIHAWMIFGFLLICTSLLMKK